MLEETGEAFLKSEPKYDVDSPDRSNVSISASAGNRFTEAANDLAAHLDAEKLEHRHRLARDGERREDSPADDTAT